MTIYRTSEPDRGALPDGWEWRMYGAVHIASGRCVSWAPQAARFVGDSTRGNFRTREAAIKAVETDLKRSHR